MSEEEILKLVVEAGPEAADIMKMYIEYKYTTFFIKTGVCLTLSWILVWGLVQIWKKEFE